MDEPTISVAEGRAAGERLTGLPSRRRPTAVFCANDLVALGLLQQATHRRQGYRGGQPRAELGRTAARLLLAEADDPAHVHEQVVFEPELVARRSTLA